MKTSYPFPKLVRFSVKCPANDRKWLRTAAGATCASIKDALIVTAKEGREIAAVHGRDAIKVHPVRRIVRMFTPRFAPLVEAKTKLQTIRPLGNRELPLVGDVVDNRAWLGRPYYSQQRRLGFGVLEKVAIVTLAKTGLRLHASLDDGGVPMHDLESLELAKSDGFPDLSDMLLWFATTHGLPFSGCLTAWRPLDLPSEPPCLLQQTFDLEVPATRQ